MKSEFWYAVGCLTMRRWKPEQRAMRMRMRKIGKTVYKRWIELNVKKAFNERRGERRPSTTKIDYWKMLVGRSRCRSA